MANQEIEVFLQVADDEAIRRWLDDRLGGLDRVAAFDDVRIYRTPGDARVTITSGIEDGPFTSVYIVATEMPWQGQKECCRDAIHAIGGVARCAPSGQGHRDEWIQVSAAGEARVPWHPPSKQPRRI